MTKLSRLILAALVCLPTLAQDYGKVTTQKVAEGVYLFTTTPYADVGFCGNVVAVTTDGGVLVFDSGSVPSTARTIIAEIAKLTPQPVRYLVNSHWHWDHWGGNEVFAERYPGLQIITHEKNKQMMAEIEPRWNGKGLAHDMPDFVAGYEKKIAEGKQQGMSPERITRAETRLAADRQFLQEKQALHKTLPNVTFSEAMTITLGGREIQILHAEAITPGDTYLYVPKEKLLVTGDILINPYPYAIGGSYPAEWLAALEHFAALAPTIVIPGHGMPQSGNDFLVRNISLQKAILQRVRESKAAGMSLEQTSEALAKQSTELAAMVGVAADSVEEFKGYFLDVYVKRAYRELSGPLGDAPDGIPNE